VTESWESWHKHCYLPRQEAETGPDREYGANDQSHKRITEG